MTELQETWNMWSKVQTLSISPVLDIDAEIINYKQVAL